jgi:protein-tyrosine phosphatase
MKKPTSILFVCLGNICRSPLAEAIFKKKVAERGLKKEFVADSCGTANYHVGDAPDPRTIKNALGNNTPISHVGRQLHGRDLEAFDLILAMDESNLNNIMRLPNATQFAAKIKLMRSFDSVGKKEPVPDPYYGTEADFQNVFDILDRSIDNLLNELEA